jgi:hypothetical protein
VKDCLVSNGLYNQTLNKFVMQDVKDLVPGFLKTISEDITDISGVLDWVYHGGRLEKKRE